MKNKKTKKGYVLALVIVITFILTVTVTSTFTLIMRYMIFAQKDLQNFAGSAQSAIVLNMEEGIHNA